MSTIRINLNPRRVAVAATINPLKAFAKSNPSLTLAGAKSLKLALRSFLDLPAFRFAQKGSWGAELPSQKPIVKKGALVTAEYGRVFECKSGKSVQVEIHATWTGAFSFILTINGIVTKYNGATAPMAMTAALTAGMRISFLGAGKGKFRAPAGPSSVLKNRGQEIRFDSQEQEDAFFDVFDSVRGKSFDGDSQEFQAASAVTKASHTIFVGGDGEMRIVETPAGAFMLMLGVGGEMDYVVALKKSGAALKATIDSADSAADAVD